MSLIKFKLVFPPPASFSSPEEQLKSIAKYLELFKDFIKSNSIIVKEPEVLHIVRNEETIPQFTEMEVEITAEHLLPGGNVKVYEYLCKIWMDLSERWSCAPQTYIEPPLLMISNRRAFTNISRSSHQNIPIKDIQFGIFPKSCEFMSFASLQNITQSVKVVNFFHDKASKLEVPFSNSQNETKFKPFDFKGNLKSWILTLPYKNIRRIIVHNNNTSTDLYLDLLHPPTFYIKEVKKSKYIGEYEVNHRRLEVSERLNRFIIGRTNVLLISFVKNDNVSEIISRLRYRCQGLPVYYCYMQQTKNTRFSSSCCPETAIYFRDFACQYLLTAIFERNFSFIEQCQRITSYTSRELRRVSNSIESKHIEKTLTEILFAIDSGKFVHFPQSVISLSTYYSKYFENNNCNYYIVPEKSKLIRRVTITPTRLLLWPPEIMFENRVLRNYDPDFALRISLREDDMQRLSFNAANCEDAVFEHAIKKPLNDGIKIGDRTFEFLGWSNSQIRDHGVWCYARDKSGNRACHIRQWMGDFSHINQVSKYMARMGQAFSQTEDSVTVPLDAFHVLFENDIEGGFEPISSKPYCFSDGIGKISMELAEKVHAALGHDKHCSAFQIRYGGCKGMLVIDPTLKNTDIVFRKSMKKFESPSNTRLEIARTSAPSSLQLNRPFITLLNQMGIPPRIFLQLQERHLCELVDILLDEEKAVEYLKSKTPLSVLTYEELSKSGIELTTEPFFRSLLLSLHLYHIDKIKTRANIAIDANEGRNMLGVLDETGTLQYGEVFVQYSKDILLGETTLDTEILTGIVLVTKNPCMHPGDVRKFKAVDVPALHHITDCIVFPQKGPRPHPNEMAGSDLDGDEYAVIWKKELIFSKENFPPANYPSYSAPTKLNIGVTDMIDFLVEYIKNDQVGIIASAHLALSDKFGISHPLPIQIAAKFSVVVDYAKSGVTRQLKPDEKPKELPDFMENRFKATYKSDKALGKLFRVCKDFEATYIHVNYQVPEIKVDPLLIYPGWEKFKDEAVKSRDKYNGLLSSILQTYGVQWEAEAFSGSFMRVHCRFQERKDRAEVEKVVVSSIKALCKYMKDEFMEEADNYIHNHDVGIDVDDVTNCFLQKASAWYIITYDDPNATYLSFPWIVSQYLADIKLRNSCRSVIRTTKMPVVDRIDRNIQNNIEFIRALPLEAQVELNKWNYGGDKSVVELPLRIIMQWAWDVRIIQEEGYSNRGFLYRNVFTKLFLHVVEKEMDSSKSCNLKSHSSPQFSSPAFLCLAFLRFCLTLRFCNKFEVKLHVPFPVYKYKLLASQAMTTYHDIAVTGHFRFHDVENLDHGLVEMNAEYVSASCFGNSPIPEEKLQRIGNRLIEHSGVHGIDLREQHTNSKVVVTAVGTKESLSCLRRLLQKDCKTWIML